MFDISWSEFLILAVVTLIFVGPKELPVFLRTLGRYAGTLKRQAGEFRAQFEEAMRESELDQLRKEMEGVRQDVNRSLDDAGRSVESEFDAARRQIDEAAPAKGESGGPAQAAPVPMPAPDRHAPPATEQALPAPVHDNKG
jgi:sec-independent protein translocase protein TatB